MPRFYRSRRMALHHPPFRRYGDPRPDPTYQVVFGYPNPSQPEYDPRAFGTRRLAIVGEGPGQDEDEMGVPFIGRSGEELDRFLDTYQIDPDACFITNIGRTFKMGNPDPTEEDILTWEPLLQEELNEARPLWIAATGRVSARYFLGDVDMEAVHGVPYSIVLPWLDNGRGGRVVVIPVYHPAAGFHSTELQAAIAYDFAQLQATIEGRLTPRLHDTHDPFPDPDYRDLTDSAADLTLINGLLGTGYPGSIPVAIDTEGLPGNPWGLSFSVEAGSAYVIRKTSPLAVQVFADALLRGICAGRLHVILHNSLHDLRVLRELGIRIPDGSFTDTMVLAYHLCIEPQGLKPLAYRHAGMLMESYEEQVQDAQDKIAVEYYELMEALTAGGVVYRNPERVEWVSKTLKSGKPGKPRKVVTPPSEPISVGPFRYLEPYTILERDKTTGQLHERTKTVQQVHTRVSKALKELREGKITAADLRARWEQTDDLIADSVEEVIGEMREADLNDVPLPRAIRYAARDADATLRIYPILSERHEAMGLGRIGQIDHAIIPMVDRMQEIGMQVDVDYFRWLSEDLHRRMVEVQQQIKDRYKVWMNPNSGDQVADLLFRPVEDGGYGLEPTKMTKGTVDKATGEIKKRRGSTVDKVLEGLRGQYKDDPIIFPLLTLIMEYRGLNKRKTSFADVVIRRAVKHNDGHYYIHCLFRITRVSSGRLSATKPNLLAVVGGSDGIEIRVGYQAGDGHELAEWDLSQVEMRVMADESGDEFLISMIMNNEDIHTGTADRMFHFNLTRPYSKKQMKEIQHGSDKRDAAKRTGFGVITGIQGPGLVDQMRLQGILVTEDEATRWIADWLAACPSVPNYMERCHREAAAYGYVRDWAGRIRYLPGIHSPFRPVRAEAGRQSHSHKIQGGAQEIMKIAMATIWKEVLPYWWAQGKYIQPLLQIHDALMFKIGGFSDADKQELDAQVRAALFSAAPPTFKVPLDAGNGYAATWGELEH